MKHGLTSIWAISIFGTNGIFMPQSVSSIMQRNSNRRINGAMDTDVKVSMGRFNEAVKLARQQDERRAQ